MSISWRTLNEGENVGRIETRIVDFPLRESPSFLRIWARSGWTRTSHAYGVYPAPYPAYPFVRPVPLPGIGHTPSTYDSAANARVLIIYLKDVRRTCRTFAIVRARARARVRLLPHSGFRTFFVPGHCARGRGWPFSAAMFINESQLQSTDRTRIFIAGEKSHVARHHDRNSVPSNSIKMSMSRAIWG